MWKLIHQDRTVVIRKIGMFLNKKRFLISCIPLMLSSLYAKSFDEFLQIALQQNPKIATQSYRVEEVMLQGEINQRLENPSLELELSQFDRVNSESEQGFRTGISQDIWLPSTIEAKNKLTNATVAFEKSKMQVDRATFIRDISLEYLNYVHRNKLLHLAKESIELETSIYNLSRERYKVGSIAKGVILQSEIAYKRANERYKRINLAHLQSYYALLKSARINEKILIDTSHHFTIEGKKQQNPELLTIEQEQRRAEAELELSSQTLQSIGLFGEYEKEPEEDIYRMGVSFPLPIFNDRSEEQKVARLKLKSQELTLSQNKKQLGISLSKLQEEYTHLQQLQHSNEEILGDEKALMSMYREGYRISKVNLTELQTIKNALISTQKRLINIKIALYQNTILQNYLQGAYNE